MLTANENPAAASGPAAGLIVQALDGSEYTAIAPCEQASWPMTKLEWALWNAHHLGRVFPIRAGDTKPVIKDNLRLATRNEEQIRAWWTDEMTGESNDRNIGLVADGGESGWVVVDLDPKNNPKVIGDLELMLDVWGADQPTFTVETPNRGRHLYYRTADPIGTGANTNRFMKGLDTRGAGTGYVVAPGSTRNIQIGKTKEESELRHYTVVQNVPIAPMPEKLAKALRGAPPSLEPPVGTAAPLVELDLAHNVERAVDYLKSAKAADQVGSRNERTNRVAFRAGDFGISEQMCIDLMAEHWLPRCHCEWTTDDMLPPVRSAFAHRRTQIGSGAAEVQFPLVDDAREASVPAIVEAKPRLVLPETPASGGDVTIAWDDEEDWSAEPDPLMDGLINQGEVGFLYGAPGAGKSFLALRISHSVAAGIPFGAHLVAQGGVLYVMGEAHGGAKKRKAAARKLLGHGKLPIHFVLTNLNLLNKGAQRILQHCEHFEDAFSQLPKLIILDTLAALAAGLEESESKSTTLIMHTLRKIATVTGATVLVLAHEGKDSSRGLRGSSALLGAADFVLHADKAKKTLAAEKLREDERPSPMGYELVSVEVGHRRDGRPIRSAVAHILTRPRKNLEAIEAGLSASQRDLFQLAKSMLADRPPGSRLTVQDIAEQALASSIIEAQSTKDAIDSARGRLQRLQAKGLLDENKAGWALAEETEFGREVTA